MHVVASNHREPVDWIWAAAWVAILALCAGFWFGVGYGLNVGWHAIWPNPKPDPPPAVHQPKPDRVGVVCNESYPPLPQIGTAIVCFRA